MTNSPEYAEDKLPYYKVLIHRDDYDSIRLPPTEAHLIAENAEISPSDPFRRDYSNQDFKRFKITEIGGFDIVSHKEIAPFTPYCPTESSKMPAEDHRAQFNMPDAPLYFPHDHIQDYFKPNFMKTNPRLARNILEPRNDVMQDFMEYVLPEEVVQIYITENYEFNIRTTFTVRYIGFDESPSVTSFNRKTQTYAPQHWWKLGLRIENFSPHRIRLTTQHLTVKSGSTSQQFQNQIQGTKPNLEPFINPIYQYSWNQPLEHKKSEAATCWLRLDGTRLLDRREQDKFMIMVPDLRNSIILDPNDFSP